MARTRTIYLETKEDREAIRKADDAEFGPRFVKAKKGDDDLGSTVVVTDATLEPEFASVEAFAEFCMDEERESFSFDDLTKLREVLVCSPGKILKELATYGLKYEGREHEKTVRGFTSNSHNLYAGNPMCGGSGLEPNGVGTCYRR